MFSCPIDTACGGVLNMAMCLNVCLIVLKVVVVRDQFYIASWKSLFGKCESDSSIEYMFQGNTMPVSFNPYQAFCHWLFTLGVETVNLRSP